MNTQTQDLETRAKNALDSVTIHGVNGSPVDRDALQYGLENGVFDQSAVDGAEKQYHQFRAKNALDSVTRHGVNGSPVDRDALVYGVLNDVFGHRDIVKAQKEYKATLQK